MIFTPPKEIRSSIELKDGDSQTVIELSSTGLNAAEHLDLLVGIKERIQTLKQKDKNVG